MTKKCRCGAEMLEIRYGFPSGETIELERQGKVFIGGCLVDPTSPRYRCPACDRTARDRRWIHWLIKEWLTTRKTR